MPVRKHIHYSGHVQGVGFRYTVRAIARGADVGGFVRNLADGRVEVVVEGPGEEVDRLLVEVDGRMGGYVRRTTVVDEPPTGEFHDFGVRF